MNYSGPKFLLRAEGLTACLAACLLYWHLKTSWVQFGILFLAPDLSMIGYIAGKRIGAFVYNAAHAYVGPALVAAFAYAFGSAPVLPVIAIWVAHIGFDRLLGFGLKYATDFKDTHLQRV